MAKEWLKLQKGSETRICDCWRLRVKKQGRNLHGALDQGFWIITVWRVSLFRVFLLRIFSHSKRYSGEILRISPDSVQMRETTDQKSSEYGHFTPSAWCDFYFISWWKISTKKALSEVRLVSLTRETQNVL